MTNDDSRCARQLQRRISVLLARAFQAPRATAARASRDQSRLAAHV